MVGDIVHSDGDFIGYIGLTCASDNSTFQSSDSYCRNGKIVDEISTRECPTAAPFCCQNGEEGAIGAALCLGDYPECVERYYINDFHTIFFAI